MKQFVQFDGVDVDRRVDDEIYIALIEEEAEKRKGIAAILLIHDQPAAAGGDEFPASNFKRRRYVANVSDDVFTAVFDHPSDCPARRARGIIATEVNPFVVGFRTQPISSLQCSNLRIISQHRLANLNGVLEFTH